MDPQAAWDEMLAAYGRGDFAACLEHGKALLDWLDNSGFPPCVSAAVPIDNVAWHRYIARWVAGTTYGFAHRARQQQGGA